MRKNKISFEGKTALVTGGTRGIGKNIVDILCEEGCCVYYTGTKQIKASSGNGKKFIPLDLSDDKSVKKFIKQISGIGRIDILVNNAGINIIEPIDKIKDAHWEKVLKVNLTGPMLLMKEISKMMIKKKIKGKILNISSIYGLVSKVKRDSYSSSKSGLIGLTRAAALDLAPYGVLVNALCPGFTMTDLTTSILSKQEIRSLSKDIPLQRFARENEIAEAAVFLCSDLNTYMTGQIFTADGGFTIQ